MTKQKLIYIIAGVVVILLAGWFLFQDQIKTTVIQEAFKPTGNTPSTQPSEIQGSILGSVETVFQNLQTPWEIVFLPDGDMLVTERAGNLKRLGNSSATIQIENVRARGESGLLGLALHPDFQNNSYLYLYLTVTDGSNQVERYRFSNNMLTEKTIIISGIPGASNHDGGRIAFGPDGKLYITTGDAQDTTLAQDTSSLAGKILRVNDDGSTPNDNPFNNPVWSLGHRNPQGLAWDSTGRLWSTEHGRSGVRSGLDEVNLIEKGKNYGWPTIEGDATQSGMEKPAAHSGASTTWAPAGITTIGDNLYFTGLRGQSLYQVRIMEDGTLGQVTAQFAQSYGRLRAITFHNGYLYFASSNTDGRGTPKQGDDKIYRAKVQ